MSTLASLQIVLGMDSRGLTTGVAQAQGQVSKFGAGVQRSLGTVVPLSATLASVAIAKFAMDSFRAAKDFDKAFGQIAAISNATADDIEQWRGQVLDLAGETAKAPTELAEALFFLSSAGIDTSKVMDVLDSSAKAAAVGLGSTTDVAKITANALNAYAGSGLTAARVTDTLVAAVREGSAEPEEFAAALGRILPIASKAGIEFDQVTASLAALSNIGLDVNEGVTAMRGLMTSLFAPTAKTQTALKSLGLTADDVRTSLGEDGLIATLRMLEERAGGNIDVMAALVPNVRALTGVFGLTAQEASKVDAIFANVMDSTGSLSQAWGEMAENDAFKMERAFNAINVAGQKLATGLLPPLASGMQVVANVVGPIAPALGQIIVAMLLFKTVSFLPNLLFRVGLELTKFGAVGARAGEGLAVFSTRLAAVPGAAGLAVAAIVILARGLDAMSTTVDRADAALESNLSALARTAQGVGDSDAALISFAARFALITDNALTSQTSLNVMQETISRLREAFAAGDISAEDFASVLGGVLGLSAEDTARIIRETAAAADDFTFTIDKAGRHVQNFAGMSNEALEEFVTDAGDSILESIGTLDSFEKKWKLTSAAAIHAMEGMAKKAKEIAGAFKALDREAIPEALKAFLIEQGPAAVLAFVEGTERQKGRFIAAWKQYERASTSAVHNMEVIAGVGGRAVGNAAGLGFIGGLDAIAGRVEAAARAVARDAMDAMAHELQLGSPSRVTHKMGLNFSIGFANGIRDGLTDVVSAVRDVVGEGLSKARLLQAKELEAMADDVVDHLEDLKDRIQRFRDDIRSGFDFDLIGGAMDLADVLKQQQVSALEAALEAARAVEAPDQALIDSLNAQIEALRDALIVPTAAEFGVFLGQQLATAQRFARGLKALQAAGLNPKLLADLASRGPESLPFIEALLAGGADIIASFNETQSAINEIAGNAADRLVDEVFGARLDRAAERVAEFAEQVAAFVKGIHAEAVAAEADELIKALQRLSKTLDNMTDGAGGNGGRGRDRSADMVGESPAVVTGGGTGGAIDYERMAAAIIEAMRRAGPMWQPIPVPDVLGTIARTGSGRNSV